MPFKTKISISLDTYFLVFFSIILKLSKYNCFQIIIKNISLHWWLLFFSHLLKNIHINALILVKNTQRTLNNINFSHIIRNAAVAHDDDRATIFYRFPSADKLSYFYRTTIRINITSTRLQHAKARNDRLKINTERKGKRRISEDKGPRFRVQQVPETIHASKSIWVDHLTGCRGWLWVSGWSRTKFIILRRGPPPHVPDHYFRAFSLLDHGQPLPSLAHPIHFYDLIQVSNFPINEHGAGNNESADPNFCTFTIVPALKRGGNGSESCFFAARFLLSRPFNPIFQLINRPRKIYTFMENLYVNKSTECEYEQGITYYIVKKVKWIFISIPFLYLCVYRDLN